MEGSTNAMTEVIGTTFGDLSNQMIEAVTTVLPYAFTVAGTVLVVLLGWKLFKRLTK